MSGGNLDTKGLASALKIGAATSLAGLILLAVAQFMHNPRLHLLVLLLRFLGGLFVIPLVAAILFVLWLLLSTLLDRHNRKRNG